MIAIVKKKFSLAALIAIGLSQADARVWTDVKGRKIEAEYVSQADGAVVLRLKNDKEVKVPFKNLSREDLAYLIEMETKEAKERKGMKEEPKKTPAGEGDAPAAPDPKWDRPIPKKVTLEAPIQVEEIKGDDTVSYASANFRLVADGKLSEKAVIAILEGCELTKMYCEALPFGMAVRHSVVDGKCELKVYRKESDWKKIGESRGLPFVTDPVTRKMKFCLEAMGLGSSGRGSSDAMRNLVGQIILNVSRSMMPEIYRSAFKDWFMEGLPNLLNCAVYEKSSFDFTEIAKETRDFLLGKSRSGLKPVFEKDVTMLPLEDLVGVSVAGPAEMDDRRKLVGQCMLYLCYLMYLEDGGKATAIRAGMRYVGDFEKNQPKRITYRTQEELEQKKAELARRRKELGSDAMKKILGERTWPEVEKDMAAQWALHGLTLEFVKEEIQKEKDQKKKDR